MKQKTFRCTCCRMTVPKNPRVKDQRYCGKPQCQRARKAQWQREKLSTDPDYKANQREANRRWRENNPDYQKKYRSKNYEYQKRNKLLQIIRDKPRPPDLVGKRRGKSAKMDTLIDIFNDKTVTYIISPGAGNLVKMDALEVKICPVTVG